MISSEVRRRLLLASLVVLIAALAGCGDRRERDAGAPPSRTTTREEPAVREPAPRDERYVARCTAAEPTTLAAGLPSVHGIAIALGDTSQMVLAGREASSLLALASRVAPGAAPETIPMPAADGLFALEAIDGERYVVVTRGACPEGEQATHCLAARLLGPDARALSDATTIALPGPLRTVRADASGDALWIARTTPGAQPALDRIAAGETSLTVTTRALGEAVDVREEPTEILALAVSGGSWAVLWRHGAAEDATSGVVLSTQLDEHDVDALHDALVLESFQWYAGALSAIAAFEFARPLFLRIGADGEVRGEARSLPPGESLPQPFMNRRTAAIVGSGEQLALEVRDGAGDAIAPRVPIEGAFVADVARRGEVFVVAYARRREGAIAVETREITCARPSPPRG